MLIYKCATEAEIVEIMAGSIETAKAVGDRLWSLSVFEAVVIFIAFMRSHGSAARLLFHSGKFAPFLRDGRVDTVCAMADAIYKFRDT